jgi:hypothetical protein
MKKKATKLVINGITVPPEIFTKRFAPCDLAKCRHACCRYGAVIGGIRIKRIQKLLPKLFPLMRPEAVAAVKKKGFHLDTVFNRFDMNPGHKHHYMRTVKRRCVFINFDDKGGCVLQKYARAHKMRYKLKPEGCWGFPFDLVGNKLVIYKWENLPCLDDSKNKKSPPIYLSCKQELIDFMGRGGYNKLLKIRA